MPVLGRRVLEAFGQPAVTLAIDKDDTGQHCAPTPRLSDKLGRCVVGARLKSDRSWLGEDGWTVAVGRQPVKRQ